MSELSESSWRFQFATLFKLALPFCFVQVCFNLMGFVDTALAGHTNATTLAATGLGASIFFSVSVVGMGIVMGLDPLIAQALGANEPDNARNTLVQGIYVALLTALPLMLVVLAAAHNLEWFGVDPALGPETRGYVHGRVASLLPLLVTMALRAYLQAAHLLQPVVLTVLFANVVNFGVAWLVLFGDAGLQSIGLPALGIGQYGAFGLGWAATFATYVQCAVLLWAVTRLQQPFNKGTRAAAPSTIKRIFTIGVPVGLHMLAESAVFGLVGLLAGGQGAVAMAGHQVTLILASMSFSVCVGLNNATSVQVGRAIGQGLPLVARRAGLAGIWLGVGFMTASALVMWLAPQQLLALMTTDARVIELGAGLLAIAGAFQIVDGVQGVTAGALRGAGFTKITFVGNFIGHWLIGAPLGIALASWANLGVRGLWWGLTCGLAIVAVVLCVQFEKVSRGPMQRIR